MDKEGDFIHNLQNQSEDINFSSHRYHERNFSEISGWDDHSNMMNVSILKKKRKAKILSPEMPLKTEKHVTINLPRKPTQISLHLDDALFPQPLQTKLPMIKGIRSPIYKFINSHETIQRNTYIIRNALRQPCQGLMNELRVFKFTPRSIANLKSPLHISSYSNSEVLRSLSTTKRKNPFD